MKTVIIAGITRSGLTVTMQMLNAGGYPCTGTYPSFEDYVDLQPGHANKFVDTQANFPPTGEYYVIRLRRNRRQQAKSIVKMLNTIGFTANGSDAKRFERSFDSDYKKIDAWGKRQAGFMILDFEDIIKAPNLTAHVLADFVGLPNDSVTCDKMADVVIKRGTDCADSMLEFNMLENRNSIEGHWGL